MEIFLLLGYLFLFPEQSFSQLISLSDMLLDEFSFLLNLVSWAFFYCFKSLGECV